MAKLLETGIVNTRRVELFWRPVTSHLLEASSWMYSRRREWSTDAQLQKSSPAMINVCDVCSQQESSYYSALLQVFTDMGFPKQRVQQALV